MSIPISFQLTRLLDVARQSNMPSLVVGPHGIGKSEFLEGYAQKRDLKRTVLDLSLLEPTDLTGIPYIEERKTHFAPPVILPDSDSKAPHMIVFEELNRCDLALRQPCLQLLTARKLNGYSLPQTCFLVACINPFGESYDVDELDPALASRFLRIEVAPDPKSWLAWARENNVHRSVLLFIERYPQSLDRVPPRTWTYVSNLLTEMENMGWSLNEAKPVFEPLLGEIALKAFFRFIKGKKWQKKVIHAHSVFVDPFAHVEYVQALCAQNRMDELSSLAGGLKQIVGRNHCSKQKKSGLIAILDVFPEDLAIPVLELLDESQRAS